MAMKRFYPSLLETGDLSEDPAENFTQTGIVIIRIRRIGRNARRMDLAHRAYATRDLFLLFLSRSIYGPVAQDVAKLTSYVINTCDVFVQRGEGNNPGTKQRPFASIAQTRERLRAARGSI